MQYGEVYTRVYLRVEKRRSTYPGIPQGVYIGKYNPGIASLCVTVVYYSGYSLPVCNSGVYQAGSLPVCVTVVYRQVASLCVYSGVYAGYSLPVCEEGNHAGYSLPVCEKRSEG